MNKDSLEEDLLSIIRNNVSIQSSFLGEEENFKQFVSILNLFLTQSDIWVYYANHQLSDELFKFLSLDNDWNTRYCVAINIYTPVEVLHYLASDIHKVKVAVANNTNTQTKTLIKLSEDDNIEVVLSVISNFNTPVDVLKKFINDENYSILSSLTYNFCKNKNFPEQKSYLIIYLYQHIMYLHNRTSGSDLKYLLRDLIGSGYVPNELIAIALKFNDTTINCGIAENPNSSSEFLEILSKSHIKIINFAIIGNKNTSIDVILRLKNEGYDVLNNDKYQRYLKLNLLS